MRTDNYKTWCQNGSLLGFSLQPLRPARLDAPVSDDFSCH